VTAGGSATKPSIHVLLSGPPGLGKTTLAHVIANELGVGIHLARAGPALERKGDLAGLLTNLGETRRALIDEIHRLQPVVEENLYPAMEDFEYDFVLGAGPHARSYKVPLKRFTLIGGDDSRRVAHGAAARPVRELRFG